MSFLEILFVTPTWDFLGLVLLQLIAAFAGAERYSSVARRLEVGYLFWVLFADFAVVRRFKAADEFARTIIGRLEVVVTG